MPFRRKYRRQTRGKGRQKHADTLVSVVGPSVAPIHFVMAETEAQARTNTGAEDSITGNRTTGVTCNIGDLIKYMNVFYQVGPRADAEPESNGWLEWAILAVKESEIAIPITNLGTQTLGVVANRMFPGQCLLSGNIPIGAQQANSQNVLVKIPEEFQYLKQGDQIQSVIYFRSSNATETGTINAKVYTSCIYKGYS